MRLDERVVFGQCVLSDLGESYDEEQDDQTDSEAGDCEVGPLNRCEGFEVRPGEERLGCDQGAGEGGYACEFGSRRLEHRT